MKSFRSLSVNLTFKSLSKDLNWARSISLGYCSLSFLRPNAVVVYFSLSFDRSEIIKGEAVDAMRLIRFYRVSESFVDFVFKCFDVSLDGDTLSFVDVKLKALLDILIIYLKASNLFNLFLRILY